MLACRRAEGHHTTENIVNQFDEIVSNFELTVLTKTFQNCWMSVQP